MGEKILKCSYCKLSSFQIILYILHFTLPHRFIAFIQYKKYKNMKKLMGAKNLLNKINYYSKINTFEGLF